MPKSKSNNDKNNYRDKNSRNNNKEDIAIQEDASFYQKEEFKVSNRFGKSIDQVSLDPYRQMMSSASFVETDDESIAPFRFSCQDILDTLQFLRNKKMKGTKRKSSSSADETVSPCSSSSTPQLHCVQCHHSSMTGNS